MSDVTPPRPHLRHRLRKILLWTAGVLVLAPVALVLLVLAAANTGPGRRLIETQAGSLSGGLVALHGLSGRFPDALRLAHLEVHDTKGTWLTLDGVTLDWSPTALLGRIARISRLAADHIAVARLPVAAPPTKPAPPSKGGFSLPVTVDLRALAVAELAIAPAVAGHAATLRLAGAAHLAALDDATAHVTLDRLDGPGSYRLDATLDPHAIRAVLDAAEPSGGLVSGLAALPDLGAITLNAAIDGPRTAEHLRLLLSAGKLQANAHGSVDLVGHAATLDLDAAAPAMAPRPDVSWDSVALHAHLSGPFTAPNATAHAELHDLHGGGATIPTLVADVSGNRGAVDAHAVLTGLVLPPPQPALFTAAPLDLTLHAQLDQPTRPVRFTLSHPLITADGTAQTAGDLAARLHTTIPSLAPFAAIGHVDIQGSTEAVATLARHGLASDVTVDGTARFTGGLAPLPTLLGTTTYGATARLDGQDFTISRALVDGKEAHADVAGTDLNGTLALAWHVALRNLAALSPQAAGNLAASGRLDGAPGGLALQADIKADAGTPTIKPGVLTAAIRAQGLPGNPSGTVQASGHFEGAPLQLDAQLAKLPEGGFHAVLSHADWRSLAATADLVLAHGQALPTGTLDARIARLADFSTLARQPLAGALTARIDASRQAGHPDAKVDVQATNLAAGTNGLAHLSLIGHVADPLANPTVALALVADGIATSGVTGQAHLTANGPQTALALRTDATLSVQAQPATLAAAALLDAKTREVTLSALTAAYRTETLRLRAPARVTFGAVTGVDALHLAFGPPGTAPATLDLAGRIAPTLALTATLRGVTPDLARPFAPTLRAAGLVTADARLSGTIAAPQGSLRLQASGLRSLTSPLSALAPASALATIALDGTSARIDAHVSAGAKLALAASGIAPLHAGGPLALHAAGTTDLTLLNPILGASGQRAAGNLALDASVAGTTAAPRIAGTLNLDRGEVQDFVQGVRITNAAARLSAAGDTVRIDSFTAHAGAGTLAAGGTIGVLAPGLPVDIHLTADHARPLASDLLTATLDANLIVHGQAAGTLDVGGRVFVRQADINIPNGLPPSVAVLHVRRPGDKPPAATPPGTSSVRLALLLDAPTSIFIRGHGVDSELGGKLTVGGTTAAPQVSGGFEMRRGTISVAGTTLNFSHGEVGFDGTSVTNKIDPTLNFVADSNSGSVVATLTVGGYADAPTIKLSSVPDMPQDEVLAHLLFGTSVKDLSAIQIAEIAAALAELSGVTGGGTDPLGAVRKGLGLDRLSVGGGGGSASTGATVEAGRYVARGVFVGAKQATSGGGTAAEVQIDITHHLKAKAQLATGGGSVQGATPDDDQGSTIGLSYQFEY